LSNLPAWRSVRSARSESNRRHPRFDGRRDGSLTRSEPSE